MSLDINGAGRSRSLGCLPAARGTVAPTRGQVPGGVLLGTSIFASPEASEVVDQDGPN